MNDTYINGDELVKIDHNEKSDLILRLIEQDRPLLRKKKDGSYAFIPPSEFDQYLKDMEIDLYIDARHYNEYKMSVRSNENGHSTGSSGNVSYHPGKSSKLVTDDLFKSELRNAEQMDSMERLQTLINGNYRIQNLEVDESKFGRRAANEISDVFTKVICINRTILDENLNKPVEKDFFSKIISETEQVIDNLITFLTNGKSTFVDLSALNFLQTGSTTISHMNRMLMRTITFLHYFNSYFISHSNDIKRIRSGFREKFHKYYTKLFDDSQKITLEIAFKGGIAPVSDKKLFLEYALGGFFHDIGKLPEIEYHDSDEGFVPAKARRHVFDSYNMLLQAGQFSLGTVAMGLLHHDYYNAPYGYRQRDTLRKKFDRRKSERTDTIITRYCMSQNIMDVVYGNALAYFPSKILELLDVFDAMTDSEKTYKKEVFSAEEALGEIRHKYIETGRPGIDPILFNIFTDFLMDSGIIHNSSTIDRIKI